MSDEDKCKQETEIRREIKAIYNKGRHDFETDEEFDEYLEEIENKIYRWFSPDHDERNKLREQIKSDKREFKQQDEFANQEAKI